MNQTGLASHAYILQDGLSVFLPIIEILEVWKEQKNWFQKPASKHIILFVLFLKSISFLPGRLSLEIRKDEGRHVLTHNCVGGYPVASQIEIDLSKVAVLHWPKKLNKKNVVNPI